MKDWPLIANIDMNLVRQRLQDNYALFTELARNFVEQTPWLMQQIKEQLKHRNFKVAARYLHQVKGKCANLGATGFAEDVAQMEQAARNGSQPDHQKFEALVIRIQKLSEQLGQIQIRQPQNVSSEYSLDDLQQEFEILQQLLEQNRMDAIEISQKLSDKAANNEQIQHLNEMVNQLQFAQALKKLHQLMRKTGFE